MVMRMRFESFSTTVILSSFAFRLQIKGRRLNNDQHPAAEENRSLWEMDIQKNNTIKRPEEGLTRREALITGGKYAALTAATLLVLTPKAEASDSEPAPPPQWGP